MLCLLARSSTYENAWVGQRMGECIGIHSVDRESRGLAAFYLENKLEDGQENYLEVLHPGNIQAKLITTTPLPSHMDEKVENVQDNLFSRLYRKAFNIECQSFRGTHVTQVRDLGAWDGWYAIRAHKLVNWPGDPLTSDKPPKLKKVFPSPDITGFTPCTIFSIGPFTKKGPVLFSFDFKVSGDSYDELVARNKVFTIDGPDRLLHRIKYEYLPFCKEGLKDECKRRLDKFTQHISLGEGYDIVLLGKKFADQLTVIGTSSIHRALMELPSKDIGVRYTTRNPNFKMLVRYSKNTQWRIIKRTYPLKQHLQET